MEGLFFAVNQVWFIYPINYGYLLVSLLLVTGICYYNKSKNNKTVETSISNITYIYIDPKDTHYNQKTLHSLRDYISKKYLPKHTWAHTNIDIKSYIENKKILRIIESLEQIEYSWKETTIKENEENNSQLALLLR